MGAPLFTDLFEHTALVEADALRPLTNSGWTFDATNRCWKSDQPGSVIEFEIAGRAVLTMHRVIRGPMGRARATVDGGAAAELEGWFDQTWGGYRQTRGIARDLPAGKHRVRFELLAEKSATSTGHEFCIFGLGAAGVTAPDEAKTNPTAARPITVASYYFGNYHPGDARNTKMKGKDWSEWELVKAAKPRFPGHHQPNVPLWGYVDESDPQVMAKKIAAAADHGIDAFIFDWYYYDDGPFLERPIDEGFLKATNNYRIKFAFMWANHDWFEIQPYKRGTPQAVALPRQGDARQLRQNLRPRHKGLLPTPVVLADRGAALLLVLRSLATAGRISARWKPRARRWTSSAARPAPPVCRVCT